jgi:DNA-binding transcriptional regulator YhcF (GntR family)
MQILEDKKIIYTERTNGKFVTMDSSISKEYKKDIFNEMVSSFLEELQSMGYSKEEIIKKIMEVK